MNRELIKRHQKIPALELFYASSRSEETHDALCSHSSHSVVNAMYSILDPSNSIGVKPCGNLAISRRRTIGSKKIARFRVIHKFDLVRCRSTGRGKPTCPWQELLGMFALQTR